MSRDDSVYHVAVIETKGRESEFVSVREECSKIVDDINTSVIKLQATMGPSLAAAGAPY